MIYRRAAQVYPYKIQIAILTCERVGRYVDYLIKSLFNAKWIEFFTPINIVIDTNNRKYLKEYSTDDRIRLHYLSNKDNDIQCKRKRVHRCNYGHFRCINIFDYKHDGILIFEDDAVVDSNIFDILGDMIKEIENESKIGYYLFTLYPYFKDDLSLYHGKSFSKHPAVFYAQHCMYYPLSIIEDVKRALLHGCYYDKHKTPTDLLLGKNFAIDKKVMYRSIAKPVKCIGKVSHVNT